MANYVTRAPTADIGPAPEIGHKRSLTSGVKSMYLAWRTFQLRMATGARTIDILRQFLIEAMMVSGAGGLAGAVLGVLAGLGAATLFRMPVIFSATSILGAAFCAVLTGLLFGLMPALRAARLEPVAALARE